MRQRVYEAYAAGDRVEIRFANRDENEWQPAVVVRRDPPGVWVRTSDGHEWFVTNSFRIRPVADDAAAG